MPAAPATPPRRASRRSMDGYDRENYLRHSAAETTLSSSAPTKSYTRSRHKKSASSPSYLQSPPLAPMMSPSSPSSSESSAPQTPSFMSMTSTPAIVLESDVEPLDLLQSEHPVSTPTTPTSSFFFGRYAGSTSHTPAATPPSSPALNASSTHPSVNPSPSTTPPSSPSPSFLATWGRLPSIPRPSPMTPFRAARKVVTSVTSVGTGLLPSKEQLESIPVAGRILKHPVMDSTLTYIASKTTGRGKETESKIISPEDAPYLKLNKKLVDQSISLASLAMEKEEQYKTLDDDAGDDAFELYLAAISTLMHALPIETCDPLRREAFESQLRNFLKDNQIGPVEEDLDSKQQRRRRRRRQREHRQQATSLIYRHSDETSSIAGSSTGGQGSRHPQEAQPQKGQHEPSTAQSSSRKRRGRRHRDGPDQESPTLGETIVSTAVQSAIRLKQSPIPGMIKTCFQASRVVLSMADEKFHLQEKAWQLSKHSIEKAIELDEQYAIHEVVTETLFATVTGLVKAGIAYKETPSYSSAKALTGQEQPQGPNQGTLVSGSERSLNPQAIIERRASSSSGAAIGRRRRYSIIAEVEEEEEEVVMKRGHRESRSDRRNSMDLSSDYSDDDYSDDDDDSFRGRRRMGRSFDWGRHGLLSTAASGLGTYNDHEHHRIGLMMALKGAAAYFVNTLAK